MNILFVFSSEIPDDFAIAVLYIVTERPSEKRWSTIRKFWFEDAIQSEKWMMSLIEDNPIIHPYDSMGWWKTQVIGQ